MTSPSLPSFESDMSRCPCGDKPKNPGIFNADGTLKPGWRQVKKDYYKGTLAKDCCPCGLRVWSKRHQQFQLRRIGMHLMSGRSREVWEWWFERQGYAQPRLVPQGPRVGWQLVRAAGYENWRDEVREGRIAGAINK